MEMQPSTSRLFQNIVSGELQEPRLNSSERSSAELEILYGNRFDEHIAYRNRIWQTLVSQFFIHYITKNAIVLDLGCGYGEFINNVVCSERYAMDLNRRSQSYLDQSVNFLFQDCSSHWPVPDASLDLVFTSNFFEHLPSQRALSATLIQVSRCLKPGGRLIAMGPNIKFVGGAYWDFCDHHLPLTDVSLAEAMRANNFLIERALPRFLPYTMSNRRPVPTALVSLYLHLPLAWRLFGTQFLVIAKNQGRRTREPDVATSL